MAKYRIVPQFTGGFDVEECKYMSHPVSIWQKVTRSPGAKVIRDGRVCTINIFYHHDTELSAEKCIRTLMESDNFGRDQALAKGMFEAKNPPREVPPFKYGEK